MNLEKFCIIDVEKGIGILLVLLAHCLPKETDLWNIINQFHMPLFYFISGYLYKDTSISFFLKNKVNRLIIPYYTTTICAILLDNLLKSIIPSYIMVGGV